MEAYLNILRLTFIENKNRYFTTMKLRNILKGKGYDLVPSHFRSVFKQFRDSFEVDGVRISEFKTFYTGRNWLYSFTEDPVILAKHNRRKERLSRKKLNQRHKLFSTNTEVKST